MSGGEGADLIRYVGIARHMWFGDPPPAARPHIDAVWSVYEGRWLESDESFLRRVEAAVRASR